MKISRDWEPAYAGGHTFWKVPLVLDAAGLTGADVVIAGAPVDDLVTNRPGARFGPRAVRVAHEGGGEPRAWHMDLGIDPFAELTIVDHGDAPVTPGDAYASHRAIRSMVGGILDVAAVPVVIGGDHSIAYPDIAAVAERYDNGTIAVVQFDTHTDTATENWGVKWAHGTPFRNLVDGGILPGERLVQIGIRGTWPYPEEFAWAREHGVRWHRMEQVWQNGVDMTVDKVLEEIGGTEHLFLSVDIDVLDPAHAPGTGTPEPGGMSTFELLRMVRLLVLAGGLVGMELVEVSPPYDHAEITSTAANRVIIEALSALAAHRSKRGALPEDPASTPLTPPSVATAAPPAGFPGVAPAPPST